MDLTPDSKRKVLLIGWDAADWEHMDPLLEAGEMPTLAALIDGGVRGNLATLQPVLSPMLWNSVATGKYAYKHGVHGFIEPDPANGGARPTSSYSRKVKALWNMFTQAGLRSNVVGWWASHPAEPINGTVVTNAFNGIKLDPDTGWKCAKGTIHPEEKTRLFAQFKVFSSELSQEHILPFIPNAERIDQATDERLSGFVKTLTETATIQSVATAVMELEPWDFTAIYFSCIDHLCHGFMQYHPPRMPNTPEEDFEIYKDVINGAYRFHDMMLERQLELAGPDVTVVLCSDHGFQSGSLRPFGIPREPAGPAIWHREHGMIVVNGPGIKKGERIYGASLIDIAPTILALYDLPIGEDMDGRVLVEAFEQKPDIKTVPSWEGLPGEAGMHASEEAMDADAAEELMEQFAALGYIDDPGDDKEKQGREAAVEQQYNLARNYLWVGDHENALKLFEKIVEAQPWETRFVAQLAKCYYQCGYLEQAHRLLDSAFDIETNGNPSLLITWGSVQLGLGNRDAGLLGLRKAEATRVRVPGIYVQLGDIYLKLNRLDDAHRCFSKAVLLHAESAMGHQGLSTVYRKQGKHKEAVESAMKAISLVHRLPEAHFNLGVALARAKQLDRAIVAFRTARKFAPKNYNVHRWLSAIYRIRNDSEMFAHHRLESMRLTHLAKEARAAAAERRATTFPLPEIPDEKEREAILLRERPDPQSRRKRSGKTFTLVSGLPRSGTSLMMQMLEAGGMAPLTDGEKQADSDNPKGYFEWEAVKRIRREPTLLDDEGMEDKAIKVVTALLREMPLAHDYKVIFMSRPIEEVAASQEIMLRNRGTEGADLEAQELERGLIAHRTEVMKWMGTAHNVTFLVVDYPLLVANPSGLIPDIVKFVGEERLPEHEKMASVIDDKLYRQRMSPAQKPSAASG